jgi:hypothetical protein
LKAKIRHIIKNVNPFGGILFCMHELQKMKIPDLIDRILGKKPRQSTYSYSDVLLSWAYAMLVGSERLEDVKQLAPYFKDIPENKHPSPDRIGGIFKSLATPLEKYVDSKGESEHFFSLNPKLNELMLSVAIQLGQLNSQNKNYTLDYDNIVIPCEKKDTRRSYKRLEGYCPGVSMINDIPVYVEGRNGNAGPSFQMTETLERSFDLLDQKGIHIKRFRSDAAAYSQNTFHLCDSRGIKFYVRAGNSKRIFEEAIDQNDWYDLSIDDLQYKVTSTDYTLSKSNKSYRVVISKCKSPDPKYKNDYTGDNYVYRAIITNDEKMTDGQVIAFYNQRGTMETYFTHLLNDWSWKRLPFSYLNQNHVFMIVSAIAHTIYRHLLKKFSQRTTFVKPSFRLKNFISHFIAVALEWVVEDKEKIPRFYVPVAKDYSGCG